MEFETGKMIQEREELYVKHCGIGAFSKLNIDVGGIAADIFAIQNACILVPFCPKGYFILADAP